jgi:hypothetical protein
MESEWFTKAQFETYRRLGQIGICANDEEDCSAICLMELLWT